MTKEERRELEDLALYKPGHVNSSNKAMKDRAVLARGLIEILDKLHILTSSP